jgi:hypothetical protein
MSFLTTQKNFLFCQNTNFHSLCADFAIQWLTQFFPLGMKVSQLFGFRLLFPLPQTCRKMTWFSPLRRLQQLK